MKKSIIEPEINVSRKCGYEDTRLLNPDEPLACPRCKKPLCVQVHDTGFGKEINP